MLMRVMTLCFDPVHGAFNAASLRKFFKAKKLLSNGAQHCRREPRPSLTTYRSLCIAFRLLHLYATAYSVCRRTSRGRKPNTMWSFGTPALTNSLAIPCSVPSR